MLILPGEKNSQYVIDEDTNTPIFFEPVITIGLIAKCIITKVWPVFIELEVTHIDNQEVSIKYKAVHRMNFINQDVNSVFFDDIYKREDVFEGRILSLGDNMGLLIGNEIKKG